MRRHRTGWGVNPSIGRHHALCSLLFLLRLLNPGRHRGRRQTCPTRRYGFSWGLRRQGIPVSPPFGGYRNMGVFFILFLGLTPPPLILAPLGWKKVGNCEPIEPSNQKARPCKIGMEVVSSSAGAKNMPIHDWTRVDAGLFHAFHQFWIATLSRALNTGVLPADYYALPEQSIQGLIPDVLTLRSPVGRDESNGNGSGVAAAVAPSPDARRSPRRRDHLRAQGGSDRGPASPRSGRRGGRGRLAWEQGERE